MRERIEVLVVCRAARYDGIAEIIEALQLRLHRASDINEALGVLGERKYGIIVTEQCESDALLRSLTSVAAAPVIVVAEDVSASMATRLVRLGAYDCVSIGPELKRCVATLLSVEHPDLQRPSWSDSERAVLARIVCRTPEMQAVVERVRLLAKTPATTGLVLGETGSGKELIASSVHALSARARKPFVAVDCSAIPETLFESELFGHERGAFSGATSERKGRFELADGGTLFLDEIGELPLSMQAKVLRALEERQIWRVGAIAPRKVDIRVLAATHRQLSDWVSEGRFRQDLFYRLSVFLIDVPPLRARTNDILDLADFFLRRFCVEQGKAIARLSPAASSKLVSYSFPGNVRELRNIIEQAVATGDDEVIDVDALRFSATEVRGAPEPRDVPRDGPHMLPLVFGEHALEELEVNATRIALTVAKGNQSVAARLLGVSRIRIANTVRRHQLMDKPAKKGRPRLDDT